MDEYQEEILEWHAREQDIPDDIEWAEDATEL